MQVYPSSGRAGAAPAFVLLGSRGAKNGQFGPLFPQEGGLAPVPVSGEGLG